MTIRKPLTLSAVLLLAAGCQTVPYQGVARDVKKKPQANGIIAIPLDPRPEDRSKAEEKMRANCAPGVYKVVDESEVVTGQKTNSTASDTKRDDTRQGGSIFGLPFSTGQNAGKDTTAESVTTAVKEWQLVYECIETAHATIPSPIKKK